MTAVRLVLLAAGLTAGVTPAAVAVAQPAAARSSVRGFVRDSAGRPVAGAVVRFESIGRSVVTGDDGQFAVIGLAAGRLAGSVRRLGYLPGDFVLELPAAAVQVSVEVRMAPSAARLPTVMVDGERRDFLLLANGYYERARTGNGTFLGPEFLDTRRGIPLHTVLREVPRVRMVCDPVGLRCDPMFGQGASCAPRLWVDGMVAPAGVIDEIVPRDRVRAIEVYSSAAFVPGDFLRPGDVCGAIAIWTELAPTWSRYLPRKVVQVPLPPPALAPSAGALVP